MGLRIHGIFKYTRNIRCWFERFWDKTIERLLGFLLFHLTYIGEQEGITKKESLCEQKGLPKSWDSPPPLPHLQSVCPTPMCRCVKFLYLVIIVNECFYLHRIYSPFQLECFSIPLWNFFWPYGCSLEALTSAWARGWHQGESSRCSLSGIWFLKRVTQRLKKIRAILREVPRYVTEYCHKDLTELASVFQYLILWLFPQFYKPWALVFQAFCLR